MNMDEINLQVFNTIEELRTVRIVFDVPTVILSAEDYLNSASDLIKPFLAQWETKNAIRLLVVDVYPRHTYIAIDINNEQYDYPTAHKHTSVLPVHILRLSRRSNKWTFFRRTVEDQVAAWHIAELHRLNGQNPLPFLADHIKGTVYLSPRTT
ncbi:hypothetical protein CDV55_104330 [Aspergillus turcosus]|uniref:Uncharacterized protein n=1 Tax=Aspergillus turcosus TaxID=1245748 RepID=A0A397GTQ9_9EURO|nr:hypothetical protein CDV55_104330 [Aspergillus turcosus]RLL96112.1 hypothetical protein CFD26_103905 [Aspergillus turcosus]